MKRIISLSIALFASCFLVSGCSQTNKETRKDTKPSHEEIVKSEKERCEVFCKGECERLKAFGGPAGSTESSMIQATDQMADADQLKRLCSCKCETEQAQGREQESQEESQESR